MAEENKYNITIECGADFVLPFTWYDDNGMPIDLTGATIEAQLRETASSPDAYNFICTHNGAGGRITLTLPKEVTTDVSYSYGVYDVFVNVSGVGRKRPLFGDVYVQDHVTKTIAGEMLYAIGVSSIDGLPEIGLSNRLYYVYDERAFYQWNGTGYIKAIAQLEPVGEWDANTGYANLNIVTRNGFAYIAKKFVPAGTPLTNTEYWQQITYGLTIGTVTTIEPGTGASATITGIPEDPRLNLWIPKGEKGEKGTGLEDIGELALLDVLDYNSDYLINKPEPYEDFIEKILGRIQKFYPDLPWEIFLAVYLSNEILYMPDAFAEYIDTLEEPELIVCHNGEYVSFMYSAYDEALVIMLNPQRHVPEAPMDDNFYVRQNGQWVPVQLNNL